MAGLSLLGVALGEHQHQDAVSASQAARRGQVHHKAAAESAGRPAGARATPAPEGVSTIGTSGATLVIPALSVRAPIVATDGVDGSMVVPTDIHTVGWYDGIDVTGTGTQRTSATATPTAPFPGQPGVAVLAGHVDWAGEGPGALYYLAQLEVGDPVQVVGSNGVTTHWRVSRAPVTISKSALPASLFANSGPSQLALVTCGGPFDATTGHYLDNVIVWASPATAS